MTLPDLTPAPPDDAPVVHVELFPDAISAFLRAGDAAPAHPWWEGVPLPASTEDDRTAARRYTATRRAP